MSKQTGKTLLWFFLVGVVIFECYLLLGNITSENRGKLLQNGENSLETRRKKWKAAEELSQGREKERIHRFPNLIGIGIQKCGTEALRTFIAFHPYMRVLGNEGKFFGTEIGTLGMEYYKNMLPTALEHEILMEKTPSYFHANPINLPQIIRNAMPGVKLVLILCNPVRRALSQYAMDVEKGNRKLEPFDNYVQRRLRGNKNIDDRLFNSGVYRYYMDRWLDSFNDSLLVVNGESLINDPGIVIEELQRFLKIPLLIQKEDFVKNERTGMFCVRSWWNETGEQMTLQCLPSKKGRTRSKSATFNMSEETKQLLKDFYNPHNEKLYERIGKRFNW